MKLKINFKTNKFLGNIQFAEKLFNFLKNHKEIIPNKIGIYEPLKKINSFEFKEFMKYWYDEKYININTIIWGNKKNYGIFEYSRSKSHSFNGVLITLKYKNINELNEFLNNISIFFDENNFLFGRISLDEEYDKYNILKNTDFFFNNDDEKIFFNDGGTCPILPVGLNLRKHIPGLYWRTLLGKIYVDWIGEKIYNTPAYKINKLPNGSVMMQFYENPEQFNDEIAINSIKSAKKYLGEDIFFDINDIDRKTRSPEIDISEISID